MKGSVQGFTVAVAAAVFSVSVGATPVAPPPPNPTAPPPPPITPGQVQSSLPTQQAPGKPAPGLSNNAPTNATGVARGGTAIKVESFLIQGNSAIDTATLQAQIAGYVGKTLTLAELYDVADMLTRYYRSKGYGLADVSLPAQTLSNGAVRLQVIEGHVGKITITGNSNTRTSVLAERAESLHSGDVYTNAAAERAVLLMNDLPGVQAHAVLSPGTDFGSSDVLFNVDETRVNGDASLDDYGRAVIGRWRLSAEANVNSLTGSGDQLNAGITHSDGNRLNFGKLSYALPVGAPGGTLTTSYNRAEYHGLFSNGTGTGPELPFSGSTQNAVSNWQYAATRTQSESVYWNAGLSWDNSRSLSSGTNSLTTNILLLQLGNYFTVTSAGGSVFSVATSVYTNGRHYDPSLGPNNRSRERLRAEVDTNWQLPFAEVWSFLAQANGSYSVNTLTDSDKFNLGGPGSVLGYQSAEERGDSGYFLSGELQRTFVWGTPMAAGLFLDNGKVWDKAETIGVIGDRSRGISSAGLDWQLLPTASRFNARLQWAYSVGRKPADGDKGGHIWFTVGMTY